MDDKTIKFSIKAECEDEIKKNLTYVYNSLKEKHEYAINGISNGFLIPHFFFCFRNSCYNIKSSFIPTTARRSATSEILIWGAVGKINIWIEQNSPYFLIIRKIVNNKKLKKYIHAGKYKGNPTERSNQQAFARTICCHSTYRSIYTQCPYGYEQQDKKDHINQNIWKIFFFDFSLIYIYLQNLIASIK